MPPLHVGGMGAHLGGVYAHIGELGWDGGVQVLTMSFHFYNNAG